MPTIDHIEVKFAVEPGELSEVLKALPQQPGKVEDYTVHFFDRQPLALIGKGLIIRLRQRPAKVDDATFKVRGDDAQPALAAVGGESDDRKLEGDQNVGSDVKESFSITSEPPLAKIQDALDGKAELRAALHTDASKLMELAEMSWDGIGFYGPIQAKRWKARIPGTEDKVTVELWKTTNGIELLEVSGKVDATAAEEFGDKLSAFMLAIPGVKQLVKEDGQPASKTEFALMNSDYRSLVVDSKV